MKDSSALDEMFGGDPLPFRHIYETAQVVVNDYMKKHNCKIEVVAEKLGTTRKYLYAILDPKQESRRLSVDMATEITILTGDHRIIDAFKEASKVSGEFAECNVTEIIMATLKIQSHTGSLSETLFEAISDGKLDDKEREKIRRKAMDEISALYTVISMTK